MCGILGLVSTTPNLSLVEAAASLQGHRGPDAQDVQVFEQAPWHVHLAHQRLSIIDLTAAANQPFGDEAASMIFNGEIYNYIEIREKLKSQGISFHSQSDTEVVFRAIAHWGLDDAVIHFNGMWSIAYFDFEKKELQLSRDRLGIKPLYYYQNESNFVFGSEIKALLKLSQKRHPLNLQSIGSYIEQHLLEADPVETFFSDIYKLPPGHNAVLDLSQNQLQINIKPYWELKADSSLESLSLEEATRRVREKIEQAVHLRLRSDVPIGILLSGGLDSSTLAALAHKELKDNTKLLSYVSDNKEVDESRFIDIMARDLNCPVQKVKIEIQSEGIVDLLKKVTFHNDQPLHSFSALAHYLLMKKAKDLGLTVILSGQGADESLCGYRKYVGFYFIYLLKNKKPFAAIKFLFGFLINGTLLQEFSLKDAKRYLPQWRANNTKSVLSGKVRQKFQKQSLGINSHEAFSQRQIRDLNHFSVPSLLHYEDRMSMAHSREVRVPFLDHNLVETLISLPTSMKMSRGWTKFILRKAMQQDLPQSIAWRKDKKGFTNPEGHWLKTELQPLLKGLFDDQNSLIFRHELIDQKAIQDRYQEFCQGRDRGLSNREIFGPLALNLWLEQFQDSIEPPAG